MKQKKIVNLFLALVLTLSMLFACASATAQVTEDTAAAEQLLMDLTGSYQELWPVILDSQYDPLWLDDCAALVGEENAQAAYEKLSSMVTGTIYGEEAVQAYANGGGVYDCSFTEGLVTLEFDGETSVIKGYDAEGNELFSHAYHYTMSAWKKCAGCTSTKATMRIPASSLISASRPILRRRRITSNSVMAAIWTRWVSMTRAIMPTGWQPAFPRTTIRR